MSADFVMPKAGITMDEGTVVTWLVKPGEAFKEGQPLAVVETDKASIEVNANEDGVVLGILVEEGKTVPVGTPIARIGKPGEKSLAAPAAAASPAPAPAVSPAAVAAAVPPPPAFAAELSERARISPLARNLAAERGVNYQRIQGSGPGGRILRRDIEAAQVALPAAVRPSALSASGPVPAGPGKRIPLSRMRRIIAERMTLSTSTVPQFRVSLELDMTRLLLLKDSLGALQAKVSVTDFLVQACAQALRDHPNVNASFIMGPSYAESAIQQHEQVNVGLAVALDEGLIVPVIHDADKLSLIETARIRDALVEAARIGKAAPAQLSGGTFTISNLGSFGIDSFDAIVNPPEAAILAVGQTVRKPVVTHGDSWEVRPMLSLTLTSDHRVLDGTAAALFLRSLADRLEKADQFRLL